MYFRPTPGYNDAMRIALLTWFTIVAVFGPGLCCCPMAAAATKVASPSAPVKKHSCCQTEAPQATVANTPLPSNLPTDGSNCPCQEARRLAVDVLPPQSEYQSLADTLRLIELVEPFDLFSTALTLSVEPVVSDEALGAGVFLTVRDRLALVPILRC